MATIDFFVDGGKAQVKRYSHRATISSVQAGLRYFYRVGSPNGWSNIYTLLDSKSVRMEVLNTLEAQDNDFDVILHVGDLAYNLDTDEGKFGDEFMRQIEPAAAYVPYMTVVGNHENAYNFSHYVNRFTMPNSEHNLFYSFDLGAAHFIAFSTEFYFYWNYGFEQIAVQWEWLIKDLQKANANRKSVPWIITMGHRPMYCSTFDRDDCTFYNSLKANENRKNVPWIITMGHRPMYCSDLQGDCEKYNTIIRTGLPVVHAFALEKLFYEYGVDLELWAHEHTFERMYALYNRTVFNGTQQGSPYVDPPAPVHIVTGSAGCQENTDTFVEHPGPWSAFRSSNYGFSRMQIFNNTHLYFEQTLAVNATVEDSFWLIKTPTNHTLKRIGID
uniref:Purple acid phosphatase n=1 Tax=Ditylenchus dipsaci TaxID=166011 RepID=A0A915DB86_9BILA